MEIDAMKMVICDADLPSDEIKAKIQAGSLLYTHTDKKGTRWYRRVIHGSPVPAVNFFADQETLEAADDIDEGEADQADCDIDDEDDDE